jgi:hypothetical protein
MISSLTADGPSNHAWHLRCRATGSLREARQEGQIVIRESPQHQNSLRFSGTHFSNASQRQGRSTTKIVVIGGTGLIGSKIVAILRQSEEKSGYGCGP